MQDRTVVYFTDRGQWRTWLAEHFETETEVWFVFPTTRSGEKGISYNDAVEEALCFGWIDGVAGTLDENHQLRRFTPRRKGSRYSQPNIERLVHMDDPQSPPVGTIGEVIGCDDSGSLLVRWSNGSGLNVVLGGGDIVEKVEG